jgi:hypothetical protein
MQLEGSMAKKKKRKFPPAIQFRLPDQVEGKLKEFAEENDINLSEAARRLMALALNYLTIDYYPSAENLTHSMPGTPTFAEACCFLAMRIERESQGRIAAKAKPLTMQERLQLAHQIVAEFGGAEELLKHKEIRINQYRT